MNTIAAPLLGASLMGIAYSLAVFELDKTNVIGLIIYTTIVQFVLLWIIRLEVEIIRKRLIYSLGILLIPPLAVICGLAWFIKQTTRDHLR